MMATSLSCTLQT